VRWDGMGREGMGIVKMHYFHNNKNESTDES